MTTAKLRTFGAILIALLSCAFVALASVLAPAPAQAARANDNPVVFIGFTGLPWSAVSPENTPNLYEFAQASADANLVVKTQGVTTCPAAGWLTLGTGRRTWAASPSAAAVAGSACAPLPAVTAQNGGAATIPGWDEFVQANESNRYSPTFGALADSLESSLVSAAAIGPGAALALTDADGRVANYSPLGVERGVFALLDESPSSLPDLTLIDIGSARAPGWELGTAPEQGESRISAAFAAPDLSLQPTKAQLRNLDTGFASVLAEVETLAPKATVIAASLAEADGSTAQLQYFAMHQYLAEGPTPATLARTNSTRHAGLVQTPDITLELLLRAGVDAIDTATFSGSSISSALPGDTQPSSASAADGVQLVRGLQDVNRRALLTRPIVGPFLISFGVVAILYVLWLGAMTLAGRPVPRIAPLVGRAIAAVPAAAIAVNLIPWWRAGATGFPFNGAGLFFLLLIVVALVYSGVASGVAALQGYFLSKNRTFNTSEARKVTLNVRACLVLAALVALTFTLDAATGSNLHYISVLGAQQPQDGARFYGFGNTAHIVVALSALFIAAIVANMVQRMRAAVAIVIAIGLVTLALNAAGFVGADFGGVPGIVIGFAALALMVRGKPIKAMQVVGIGAAAAVAVLGVATLDWLRPPAARTHVGDFMQSVIDGELLQILARKLELFAAAGSPLVWALTIFPIIAVAWIAWRSARKWLSGAVTLTSWALALRRGAIAAIILTIISLAINDSGPLLPFLGAAYAIPLWVAASAPTTLLKEKR